MVTTRVWLQAVSGCGLGPYKDSLWSRTLKKALVLQNRPTKVLNNHWFYSIGQSMKKRWFYSTRQKSVKQAVVLQHPPKTVVKNNWFYSSIRPSNTFLKSFGFTASVEKMFLKKHWFYKSVNTALVLQ